MKGDDDFRRVPDLKTLRLLLNRLAEFYSERKLTFQVEIRRISWSEPEGRVYSDRNSFTFDVLGTGRVERLYKGILLTETWMNDPGRVSAAAEKAGAEIFDAIEDIVRQARA